MWGRESASQSRAWFVVSHPCRKNKNAARMGRPAENRDQGTEISKTLAGVRMSFRFQKRELGRPGVSRTNSSQRVGSSHQNGITP
jgi:hypothetical protein